MEIPLLLLVQDVTRKPLEGALIIVPFSSRRPGDEAQDAGKMDDVGADVESVREGKRLHYSVKCMSNRSEER